MAEHPVIAAKKPAKVETKKGESYTWCRCGRSGDQPFCDGSHKGTGITPVTFKAEETGDAWLCQCKATGDQPFCDGTHKKLSDHNEGDEMPSFIDASSSKT